MSWKNRVSNLYLVKSSMTPVEEWQSIQKGDLSRNKRIMEAVVEFWNINPRSEDDRMLNEMIDNLQWGVASRYITELYNDTPDLIKEEAKSIKDSHLLKFLLRMSCDKKPMGIDPNTMDTLIKNEQWGMAARYLSEHLPEDKISVVLKEEAKKVPEDKFQSWMIGTSFRDFVRPQFKNKELLDLVKDRKWNDAAEWLMARIDMSKAPEPVKKALSMLGHDKMTTWLTKDIEKNEKALLQ